jgi:uncharacterized hydrophobic protein (TIGR00271 family)
MNLGWPARWWRLVFSSTAPLGSDSRDDVVASLAKASYIHSNYLVLTVASSAIATFGLLENSPAVIIGAMIIAPLMSVIQACAYGSVAASVAMFWRALLTLAAGVCLSILISAALAWCVGLSGFGSEILSRTRPNLLDLGIALAAGAVGGFALVRPSVANAVAGTAIAVALMPPLCVVGIGIAAGQWELSRGAMLLFVTNLLGITLASMALFVMAGYARSRRSVALIWTIVLTAIVVVPLAISLRDLVRQARVENALRRALTTQTATFRQATLVSSRFDWLSSPPTATLLVRSSEMLTGHQVTLLEAFAQRATGQRFRLVIDVSRVESVTAADAGDVESTP